MNRRIGLLAFATGALGCGSETLPPEPTPAALAIVTEPSATARNGEPFAVQPVVELRDVSGNPVSTRGILVTAAMASGGGTLEGTAGARSDAQGRVVFADLAISGDLGAKAIRFTAPGLTSALSGTIDLQAGTPTGLTPTAGNNQTAAAGTLLAVAPAVRVADAAGNPVAGTAVTFSVLSGGGSVTGATATADPGGVATVGGWTLGAALGQNQLRASVGSLEFVFTATAIVGAPAKLMLEAGNNQTAVIGTPVAIAPAVKLTDQFDNPISGVAITFAVTSGGGQLASASPTTNSSGVATLGAWTLGLVPGVQTLSASRSGVPSVTVSATANDFQITTLAAGGLSTCAVATTGAGWCWGDNGAGQLGDGTSVGANVPVPVQGGATFTTVAIGAGHACGIASTGAALCWGGNLVGQLGNGTTTPSSVPVPVSGGLTFTQIAVGDTHTCALATTGAIWCWGGNGNGRLGDNTTVPSSVPVAVVGANVYTALSAGSAHTCAIRVDGQAFCWGSNGSGRLGDGSNTDRRVPTAIASVAGAAPFASIAAGGAHSCGVDLAGQAFCWGAGGSGVLGNGSVSGALVPTLVAGTQSFTTVAAGLSHTCAIAAGGVVYCWGANGSGRLGDGTTANRSVPTAVAAQLSASLLRLGSAHSCARTTAGSAVCWGQGAEGQLGNAGNLPKFLPTGVTPH